MLTSPAAVSSPTSLAEALLLRAQHPEAMPLAGGTDLMVFLELGAVNPPRFIDLWGLRGELAGVEADEHAVTIGALTTYTEIIRHSACQAHLPTLVEAARTCGARQIQNRGTLGGNIANASPAGDSLPVLLALDADVELASMARGHRFVPMAGLYQGYRKLDLAPDELITRVRIPKKHPGDHVHYRKVGTRMAQSISKVVLGARVRVEDGVVSEARIAFGSVAATPIRARTVEQALLGRPVDPAAADLVLADIAPIDDIRSTAGYRRTVAQAVLRGFLASIAR